MSKQS